MALRTARFYGMFCVSAMERGHGTTDLCSYVGCCAGCQKRPQHSEGTDRSYELPRISFYYLFSFHGIGINTCFVVYSTASHHRNLPLQRADNGYCEESKLFIFIHCQRRNRSHGCFALGIFHPWSVPHIEYQTPHFPAHAFTEPRDFPPLLNRNSSSVGK